MEYVLRFFLCLLKWALIVVVVVTLCTAAFTFAMDYANINILVTDGMKTRTGVVLGVTNPEELPKFFTEEYLAGDLLLYDETYHDFTINSFDAQVEIEKLTTRPWSSEAAVRLNETAVIDGELPIALQTPEQLANPNKIRPPEWQGHTFEMRLEKIDGRWIIVDAVETEPAEVQDDGAAGADPAPVGA